MPGTLWTLRAVIRGISHAKASDVDVLLVAPSGDKVELMGAVCGPGPFTGQTFTFDDHAASPIPSTGPCGSGTYRPNATPLDTLLFPPPAPGPPYGLILASLNGSPVNGIWKLFTQDTSAANAGTIGGWSLELLPHVSCAGAPATDPADVGTAGNDVLTGTPGPDQMLGLGGNDKIKGLGGGDIICGGDGKDTLIGGPGKDTLYGGAGKDLLKGKGGKDKIKGQSGSDTCIGGEQPDVAKSCEKKKSV